MNAVEKSMEIIAYGGEGKSLSMMAIQKAREGSFEEAGELLRQAHEAIVKCHQCHSELLFYDAERQDLQVTMLLVHAADHLTSADMTEAMAEEMIHLYKAVREEKKHV
ncbi:MAG: PTS lactose/cellobiose transporter subunit IIA [Lachnospiraceae bacterium]|uniref:PTS lactose/cellobiose transporter subunit IIA n=1 Tax=Candidatus Merdisoma sp. JLR.KK011 TaxID=3114299 RepID=UPI002FF38F86|nr:PTS lactose/cellobiose transporter subunit IIA [Lachnospiraceae bacterium]